MGRVKRSRVGKGVPQGLQFLLSLIFLRHDKDGGYNSTNKNKQQPAQNTPALQASGAQKFRLMRSLSDIFWRD